jgi:hypothetical protein
MSATAQEYALFPANTGVPAGTTKGSPIVVAANVIDNSAAYGGLLNWRITNSGALGAPCTIMFQTSSDGTNWFDYWPVTSSDLSSGTVTNGPSVPLHRAAIKLRAIAYGNTTNACTVEAYVDLKTGL